MSFNLQANPRSRAGELALAIYGDVLEEVRGDRLVGRAMSRDGDRLVVQDRSFDLAPYGRVLLIAVGKAAASMASAGAAILGDRLDGGLIVTKHGYGSQGAALETIEAGHPVPDEKSLEAGRRVLELARQSDEKTFVVFLLSGGASALMESSAGDISLDDLQRMNEILLGSGADIGGVNAVRSRVSEIKAGGLARAFGTATVVVLALSDVVGNSLGTIGSGPFIQPERDLTVPYALLDRLPASVRAELLSADLMKKSTPAVPHFVVGSVSVALHAAIDAAKQRGLEPFGYQDPIRGEAAEMGRKIAGLAQRRAKVSSGFCMIFGGEATVTIPADSTGLGGRCQEMTVAAAPAVSRIAGAAFLAAGTDGTDGPTDAAGGLVEPETMALARAAGLSQREMLVRHDSCRFLEAAGGLIRTGPTGSNVNDIALFVRL